MHLTDPENIFAADRRLASCIDIHVGAQFFSLFHNGINVLKAQVELVPVLCRPAAGAVQVAGCGRIEQDRPGDIAVIFFRHLFLHRAPLQTGIGNKVLEERPAHARIKIIQPEDELIPVVLLIDGIADRIALAGIPVLWHHSVHERHQLRDILLRIALQIFQRLIHCEFLHCLFN